MSSFEAKDLLLQSISMPNETIKTEIFTQSVEQLLEELGNLPLAIAQAAANIRHLSWSIQDYVAAYRDKKQRIILMKSGAMDTMTRDPRTREQSIYLTWEISFEYLEKNFPDSAACLCYMGCYQYRAIPKSLLGALPQFKKLTPLQFQDVIKILLQLSLVEKTELPDIEEYQIHPVVHERILDRLTSRERHRYLEPNIELMSAIFPLCEFEEDKKIQIGRHLLLHAVNFVDLGSDLCVVSKPYTRLLQVVSKLGILGVTRFAVFLATKALHMASEVWDKDHSSILFVREVKIQCLNHDAQCQEALQECDIALEYLQLPTILDKIPQDQLMIERKMILREKAFAFTNSGKRAETEEFMRQQLVGEHAPTRGLDYVLMRHDLANSLKSQRDPSKLAEAKAINAELLAWAESPEGKLIGDKSLFLKMLNLKAHILTFESRLLGDKNRAQFEKRSQTYLRVYETSLELLGIDHLDTWKAANNSVSALAGEGQLEQATLCLERFLKIVTTSRSRLEGQYLETFIDTWNASLRLVIHLSKKVRHYDTSKSNSSLALLNKTTRALGGDPKEIMEDTNIVNILGVIALLEGRLTEGEKNFRDLLSRGIDLSTVSYGLDYTAHYNLMLAIARQPGRLEEAYKYRAENEAKIVQAEAIYGDLTTRTEQFKQDRLTYLEAQSRLAADDLFVGDAWWNEHKEAMTRAERMYGFLDIPERKLEEEQTVSTQEQGTPIVASQIGKKGKSRAFPIKAVFRRKQDDAGSTV